jgi:CHAD domain-containing protein/CYTH domain-containing protein
MIAIESGRFPAGALDAPVTLAVASLASDRLDHLLAARERLGAEGDGEALHDFRVALRRLRSLLRVYRRALRGASPERLRQQLTRLARATNQSRDLEVQRAWLAAQEAKFRPRDLVGLRWLERVLGDERVVADGKAVGRIEDRLPRLATRVRRRLDRVAQRRADGPSLARATAALLLAQLDEFADRLAQVRSIEDQDEAHAARIAGKRVRYLLEPLVDEVADAGTAVTLLKALQDLFGEMHDAEMLSRRIAEALEVASTERGRRVATRLRSGATLDTTALRRERRRDPTPGLLAVAARSQERRAAIWRTLEFEWLAQAEARLLDPIRAIADSLAARPEPGREIERKFLLAGLPPDAARHPVLSIDQGYLPGAEIQERIRRVTDGVETRWFRTLKSGDGLVRREIEEATTSDVFEAMWPLTEGRRVQKRRYLVPDGDLVWEIDEFAGRDLVVAEVELPSPVTAATPPEWLAPYVVREVTEEPEYLNVNLAS